MGSTRTDSASPPNPAAAADPGIPSPRKIRTSSPFWPGFWLSVVLIACKVLLFQSVSGLTFGFLLTHADQFQVPTYQDTAFAFALTLLGVLAIFALVRWPRIQLGVWILFLSFCTLCVLFSVCSYPVFEYLHTPLSINLIRAAGDLHGIRTSISGYVSNWEIAMLVIVPALYVTASILSNRYLPIRSSLLLAVILLAVGGGGNCPVSLVIPAIGQRQVDALREPGHRLESPVDHPLLELSGIDPPALHGLGA